MIYRLLLIFLFFLFNVKIILATEETSKVSRPDSHAPIGIMCDHYHKKNEIMWSYRYMLMDMDGYQKNSSSTMGLGKGFIHVVLCPIYSVGRSLSSA